MNSLYVSIGSTLVCFLFAIPAAYKMFFSDAQNAIKIALDVVDQDDASRRRTGSDLPPI
jgi:ABC-type spermidine/putrescine transport system permease subunit I